MMAEQCNIRARCRQRLAENVLNVLIVWLAVVGLPARPGRFPQNNTTKIVAAIKILHNPFRLLGVKPVFSSPPAEFGLLRRPMESFAFSLSVPLRKVVHRRSWIECHSVLHDVIAGGTVFRVVELDEDDVKLGCFNHFTHIFIWDFTLRRAPAMTYSLLSTVAKSSLRRLIKAIQTA